MALIPQREISGTFIVRVDDTVVWDRRDERTQGFPEAKVLKQLVRDQISPEQNLGHSDAKPNPFG